MSSVITYILVGAATAADAANAEPDTGQLVIFDQDGFGPGGSDMQSIAMLLQAPSVKLLGITVESGDGWQDENVAHTLRLLEISNRGDVPVYRGAVFPLINSGLKTKRWESLYGRLFWKGAWTETMPDGVKNEGEHHSEPFLVPPLPEGSTALRQAQGSAVNFLIDTVHKYPGKVTILAAGPMTNLALAARIDPEFASLAKELVFMGGSYKPDPANNVSADEYIYTPRLEFNMRWDPEAASIVLKEPWKKITQIPIDATTHTYLKAAMFKDIGTGNAPFDAYLAKFGQEFPMWDEVAVAVWLDPGLVTKKQSMFIDVDTSFTAGYGNSLSWGPQNAPGLGEQSAEIVEQINVPRFEKFVVDSLKAIPPSR